MKLRDWSGIAWYGAVFDNEEEARTWAKAQAESNGGNGRWDCMQQKEGEWFARVHH